MVLVLTHRQDDTSSIQSEDVRIFAQNSIGPALRCAVVTYNIGLLHNSPINI
jgi:hypothetical protein